MMSTQVVTVLQHVAAKERFKLPDEVASNLARDADGNTRKAVLMLEAMKMQQYVNPGIVLLRGNIRPQLIYIVMIMRSSSSCPYYRGNPQSEFVRDILIDQTSKARLGDLLSSCGGHDHPRTDAETDHGSSREAVRAS
ncbi:hypothetical protein FRC18_004009 [Serendipita sp. 400]|nr:hypothetical protein FRC18_004009 [Serendipita sp. 400]